MLVFSQLPDQSGVISWLARFLGSHRFPLLRQTVWFNPINIGSNIGCYPGFDCEIFSILPGFEVSKKSQDNYQCRH